MPSQWARHLERDAALREAAEYEDQKKAETEKLLAAHYYRRRNSVASGYIVEHRKMPRGWHHALAARHPTTRRSLLPPRAVVLLNVLYNEAERVPASTGARRVFGKTQGFYSKVCGLSMRRGRNGEANGARRIREYLKLLANLNIIAKGGRAWFDGPGKHPRLVLWILPFEQWTVARFAEALNVLPPSENAATPGPASVESDRISGSGCFSDHSLINSEVCGGMGGVGGKEAPTAPSLIHTLKTGSADNSTALTKKNKERPAAAPQNRPTAGANDGERANSVPTDGAKLDAAATVMLLGAAALRRFHGPELAKLIKHVANTHAPALDAADGRTLYRPGPATSNASDNVPASPAAILGPRPHRALECPDGASGCEACRAWVAAVMATRNPEPHKLPAIASPQHRVQLSPWSLAPKPANERPPDMTNVLNGLAGNPPAPTLETAVGRSVRWERTRCYAAEGRRCKPNAPYPCKSCVDVDFPFRTVVDGMRWKLRYKGRQEPFVLVVDGRELGPVNNWPVTWRSFGAPTTERVQTEDDEDHGGV